MYIYSVCSIFQRVFCLYLFFICRPLISFTNFIKSLSLLFTLLLNFQHGLSIDRSHVNDHFIRNFNKFRSDEALKTRWGKSDTLDCHMGVTWFDAASWLAASRRLIIFYQNIFNTCSAGWSYDDLSDITWNWWRNKLCISFSKPCDFANGPDSVAQSTGKTPVTAELGGIQGQLWSWVAHVTADAASRLALVSREIIGLSKSRVDQRAWDLNK